MRKSLFRSFLLCASSYSVLYAPVFAQTESASSGVDDESDSIVVTGTRLQNRTSIASKRAEDGIAEFVTQDEVGRIPDFNIAESARRAPGVVSIFDEDEALTIAIRGVKSELNRTEFDGFQLASTGGTLGEGASRNGPLEIVPASGVSRIEIYKSFSPDMDANAIGGTVNLATRSAYDTNDSYLTVNGSAGMFSIDGIERGDGEDLSYRLDATYATRFGANDEFGLVLSGAYNVKDRDQFKYYNYTYYYYDDEGNRVGIDDSNGIPSPGFPWWNMYPNRSERAGGLAKLEWRPAENFDMSLSGVYFKQSDDEYRDVQAIWVPFGAGVSNVIDQTPTSGSFAAGKGILRFNDFSFSRDVTGLLWKADYTPSDNQELNLGLAYSKATQDDGDRPEFRFDMPETTELSWQYELVDDYYLHTFTVDNPDYFLDPANYAFNYYRTNKIDNEEKVLDGFIDYRIDNLLAEDNVSLIAGASYRQLERMRDVDNTIYTYSGTGFTLDDIASSHTYKPRFSEYDLIFVDPDAFYEYLDQNTADFGINEGATSSQSLQSDFSFEERVFAAYAGAELFLGNAEISGGVRFEWTDVEADVFRVEGGDFVPVTNEGDYNNLLPYAAIRYDISAQLRVKAAYSQTLGRPLSGDIAGGESVTLNANNTVSISRANPDLEPREADNYDLSLEYYFPGDDGLVSLGLFQKEISNEIFVATTVEQDDQGRDVFISQPDNALSAELSGIEGNIVLNRLGFLPAPLDNFGFSANATYLKGDSEFPQSDGSVRQLDQLIQQPEFLSNWSLFYNTGRFEGRIVGNYTGDYRFNVSTGDAASDQAVEGYTQWDTQVRWAFTDQFTGIAEIRNLTNEETIWVRGRNLELLDTWNEYGRSFWVGLAYNR